MTVRAVESQTRETTAEVPQVLVYEMVRGKPVYYRGYEKVLAGELPAEAVMGSGKIQWRLVTILMRFLLNVLDSTHFVVGTNEVGFWIGPKHWRNLDLAVFERTSLEQEALDNTYVRTPPLLVIEVDTRADLGRYEGQVEWYIREKVDDLLAAGVQQVLWFTTHDRRVLEARPGQPWTLAPWDRDIPLVVGEVTLNLARLLEEAGVHWEGKA